MYVRMYVYVYVLYVLYVCTIVRAHVEGSGGRQVGRHINRWVGRQQVGEVCR